nr:MAG: replication associated protein [Cressdnaviricota sp.]
MSINTECSQETTPTKAATGFSLSQETCLKCQTLWDPKCSLCAVNWNKESEALSIGKSWSPLKRRLDFEELSDTSENSVMQNYLEAPPLMPTVIKKKAVLKELNLNLVQKPFEGMIQPIGIELEPLRYQELLKTFPRMCTFVITGICEESIQTMLDRLPWFELVKPLSAKLERAKADLHGLKQERMLTLRIQQRNGGMAIKVL